MSRATGPSAGGLSKALKPRATKVDIFSGEYGGGACLGHREVSEISDQRQIVHLGFVSARFTGPGSFKV